jgi:hypothetical protein
VPPAGLEPASSNYGYLGRNQDRYEGLVCSTGLEPARPKSLAPQASVFTKFHHEHMEPEPRIELGEHHATFDCRSLYAVSVRFRNFCFHKLGSANGSWDIATPGFLESCFLNSHLGVPLAPAAYRQPDDTYSNRKSSTEVRTGHVAISG